MFFPRKRRGKGKKEKKRKGEKKKKKKQKGERGGEYLPF